MRRLAGLLAVLLVSAAPARAAEIDDRLQCGPGLDGAAAAPVLLLHGTGSSPNLFAWNYEPALNDRGIPWCTLALPRKGLVDVQRSAALVAAAVEVMHARAGRRIAIVGHSQGGLLPRWALAFWPRTRAMVDDVVALAAPNHGTTTFRRECEGQRSCPPSNWQMATGSRFLHALNADAETVAGVSYTNVVTHVDQTVTPAESGFLHTGPGATANVALQDVCPGNAAEHLMVGTQDPVAWALAYDALTHDGPADPQRLPPQTCAAVLMPGVNPLTYPADMARSLAELETEVPFSPRADKEPPLACYVVPEQVAVRIPRRLRRVRITVDGQRLRVDGRTVHVPRLAFDQVVRIRGRRAGRTVVRLRQVKACPLPSPA